MLYQSNYTHGGDIYTDGVQLDFSVNTNPFRPPESVIQAMMEAVAFSDRYPDPYCREAVKAVSCYEGVPQNYILLGNGAAELIYSFAAAVKPGCILEASPTFTEYSRAVEVTGGEVVRYPLAKNNGFALQADILDFINKSEVEVLFLCNPNNPTGRLIDPDLLHDILERCQSRNIRLVLDECFMDFTGKHSGMNAFLETYPNLIILKALTKNYALAGIRIGYCLCADNSLLHMMSRAVQPWNVSVIAQAAIKAALKERKYIIESRETIRNEREWLMLQLKSISLWVCPSDANYILFQGPIGLDIELKKKGIMIRNCSDFAGLDQGWYRIAVRQHPDNAVLINTLRTILGKEA